MADQVTGLFSPFLRARRLAVARPYLEDPRAGRVFDVGCGVGSLARWIGPERYLGIDRDEESLAEARRRHPRHRFRRLGEGRVALAALVALEPDARFDRIAALAVIEHLDDPGGWLAELACLLAPGGRIVLTTPQPRLQWAHDLGARLGIFSRAGAAEHCSLVDRRRLEPLAAAAGLEVVEARRFLAGANQLFVLAAAGGGGSPSKEEEQGREGEAGTAGRGGRWLRLAGLALGVAALAWVARPLAVAWGELRRLGTAGELAAAVGWGAAVFAGLGVAMVAAWWWLLAWAGPRPGFRAGFAVFARSQVAKYLPGNVFHYLGRQLLAKRWGIGQVAAAGAGVLEMASMLSAAAAAIAVSATLAPASGAGGLPTAALAAGVAVTLAAALALAGRAFRRTVAGVPDDRPRSPSAAPTRWLALALPALALHLVFLLGSGLLVAALARAGFPASPLDPWRLAAAYPLAWAAGTLTPGAPAGLGVREAVLVLQLTPALGAEGSAAVAVAFRLVTTLGDLLLAAAGAVAGRR